MATPAAAAGAAGAAAAAAAAAPAPVIVVGGGVAGLTAARDIVAACGERPVIVLEGRQRLGGRVCTHRFEGAGGDPAAPDPQLIADLGANFIHGASSAHPVAVIAAECRLRVGAVPGDFWEESMRTRYWDATGTKAPGAEAAAGKAPAEPLPVTSNAATALRFDWVRHRMAHQAVEDPGGSFAALFDSAVQELKRMQGLSPLEEGMLRKHAQKSVGYVARLDDLWAEPADEDTAKARPEGPDLSGSNVVRLANRLESDIQRCMPPKVWQHSRQAQPAPRHCKDLLVLGGYEPFMVSNLRRDKVQYRLGVTVRGIECVEDGAEVVTADGERLRCAAVVCALPLGVLQGKHPETAVAFKPPLSKEHARALAGLGMGAHNKVVLRWPKEQVFWPPHTPLLNCSDPRMQWCSLHSYGVPGVLVTHLWPPFSFDIAELSDSAVVAEVVGTLRRMFGQNAVPDPAESVVTRWHQDKFAMGSYAYVPKDGSDRDIWQIGQPHPVDRPRVFFCGEATSMEGFQCVVGGYMSGQRAAREVLSALGHGSASRQRRQAPREHADASSGSW
eukprot:TRINITY_DN40015_c0_g2_i1.p1 TRINITY_DN40015_c0_g2~~TRINITY_DN40015_c0_g2_i1.p1  ORF type:complete len:559 (+),score=114.42 TRINITY_DN40015_c0_g2_i1:83-1759(+)